MKPWHDAPECPQCTATVVTPLRLSGRASADTPASEMWCPCCGEFWTETDIEVIAKAWWSRGAWNGHQQTTLDVDLHAEVTC